MDEIRDIGAGSQLVELLVSEAPNLFQEAYCLLTERLRMVHKRLSCDGSDEGKQKPMWERSQKKEPHKRQCCDRSIPGEEALQCQRLYQSQLNIGHQSDCSGRYGLLCEGGEVEREETESKRERRAGGRGRGRNPRMGISQVSRTSQTLVSSSVDHLSSSISISLPVSSKKGKRRRLPEVRLVLSGFP